MPQRRARGFHAAAGWPNSGLPPRRSPGCGPLAEIGFAATPGWTAVLGGAREPNFADPTIEPYLCADIDGAARPIAAVEFTRVGSSVADAPVLAKLAV